MRFRLTKRVPFLLSALSFISLSAHAGQPLETETARLLPAGWLKVESTFEFQTSPDGKEYDLPFALEYGIADRLEVLIEPVFFTAIRPSSGKGATGLGDLEITLSYLLLAERDILPALAPAFEVKVPTATERLIGTKQTDYRFLLIASKRFGALDAHVNVGYTLVGSPEGTQLDDVFDYALAAEYALSPRVEVVAEVLGNTAAAPESSSGEGAGPASQNAVVPEAPGTEVTGLVGARYYLEPNFFLSLGVSYDNNNAFLVRPGVTFEFDLLHLRSSGNDASAPRT